MMIVADPKLRTSRIVTRTGSSESKPLEDEQPSLSSGNGASRSALAAASTRGEEDEGGIGNDHVFDKEGSFSAVEQALAAIATAQNNRSGDVSCVAVVEALRAHGTENELVAVNGCEAVCNLSYENETIRIKLGELGACEVVVRVLAAYKCDYANDIDATRTTRTSQVARVACKAIFELAVDNETNRRAFLATGALPLVTAIAHNQDAMNEDTRGCAKATLDLLTFPESHDLMLAGNDYEEEAKCGLKKKGRQLRVLFAKKPRRLEQSVLM